MSVIFSFKFPSDTTVSLKYQRIRYIERRLGSDMLYLCLIPVSEIIKTKAVRLRVNQLLQLMLHHFALRRIQKTLKHGILHALPVIYALLCNTAQPFSSFGILSIHVV